MQLPTFRYHPNPIATGSINISDAACECCGEARGYIYSASLYSIYDVELLCPWCIADGSAARKFDGTFNDDRPLSMSGISDEITEEVCKKTPGFVSWQQERWQDHCGNACEFHGDAERDDLLNMSADELEHCLNEAGYDRNMWARFIENYEMGGDPPIYKFKCRKCSMALYCIDDA